MNGNNLVVNSVAYIIPDAGVTLSNSGLSISTLYYIYAYINSGTLTLTASTTGHSAQTGTGIQIKTGDATRSLVGMVYIDGTGNFQDAGSPRYVRSWYNEDAISGSSTLAIASNSDGVTAVAPNYAELAVSSVTAPCFFLLWANERCKASFQTQIGNSSASGNLHAMLGINLPAGAFTGGSSPLLPTSQVNEGYATTPNTIPINIDTSFGADGSTYNGGSAVNEGLVSLRMFGAVASGTGVYSTTREQTNISYITGRRGI